MIRQLRAGDRRRQLPRGPCAACCAPRHLGRDAIVNHQRRRSDGARISSGIRRFEHIHEVQELRRREMRA
jgi:hypothetical protein